MNTRHALQALAFVSVALLTSACAGVPFSTLWHYRNFGPKDFLQTDPSALRAAIQLDNGVVLGDQPRLDVDLQFKGESGQKFTMPLKLIAQGPWVGAGTGAAVEGRHWYLMGLSEKGAAEYRDLQKAIAGHVDASGHMDKAGSLRIFVQTGHLRFDDAEVEKLRGSRTMFMQARLVLSKKDGFYTLYKGRMTVPMKMLRAKTDAG